MSGVQVNSPVEGFNGEVAGVTFTDGVGEVEKDSAAYGYFERRGYGLGRSKAETPEIPEPPDPRDVTLQQVGSDLRDAAVDPESEDFLPPTNAGKANPHGPLVVAPEIHASQGVRPVRGGDVHVGDTAAQQAAELEHTTAAVSGGPVPATAPSEADSLNEDGSVPTFTGDAAETEEDVAAAAAYADVEQPAKSASKADWVEFAVANGADRDEAEKTTRDALVDQYGGS